MSPYLTATGENLQHIPHPSPPQSLLDTVTEAQAAGLCVIPPRQDGTKAPILEWKRYQSEQPTTAQLTIWYEELHCTGMGIVTGALSGVECFDFDDRQTYEAFREAAGHVDYGDLIQRIEHGYSDKTPSGGVHWYYRCSLIGSNTPLAKRPVTESTTNGKTLIEIRGEGGYAIAAPSHGTVHRSGKPYERLYGSPSTIATITPQERANLFALARTFDEMPVPKVVAPLPSGPPRKGTRPGDDFNERATWPEILEPHGWQFLYERDGMGYWRRPGKTDGQSATTNWDGSDCLRIFTSSTVLEPKMYQKFTAYAVLNHDGDWSAAARELAGQGYGSAESSSDYRPISMEKAANKNAQQDIPVRLMTRKASTIEAREIAWIWKPWLPAGMVGLFAGYGGSGKSTVALDIAAACSVGGTLPDGQQAPLLNTLIFAAEDSPEHTIIPRLLTMGADLNRIHVVDGIARENDDPGWVQLRNHLSAIEQALIGQSIGLVIIDPVSSFIGDANGDKESDVRGGIMPIVSMAERTGASVLLIRHVSKAGDGSRAASRILGSTAWHDVPRVAWMLADAPDEHQPEPNEDGTRNTRRVLGVVKSNLAAKPQARWCIQPVDGPLRWLPDPSPVTVDDCFFSQPDRGSKSRDAEAWVFERLKGGAKSLQQLKDDAGGEFTEKALRKALQRLHAETYQLPGRAHAGWFWSLPKGIGSLSLGSQGDMNGTSDQETPDSSLSHHGQVTKRSTNQGNPSDSNTSQTRPGDAHQLVTFPLLPNKENGQVTRGSGTVGESPHLTGKDDTWSMDL